MGQTWSAINQTWPPKSKWTVDQIPDLSGRVVIVTGGNVGIGYETIKALLPRNAKVYMASRSQDKAEAAIKQLKADTGKDVHFLKLDLSNLASVYASTQEFKSKEKELHILFNNAGVMAPPVELLTDDGYDLQFGTNVVGHFLFTKELLPLMIAGATTSPDKKSRVVNTSSLGHMALGISWDALKDTPERKKLSQFKLYGQSKSGNIVFANEVARRYADKGIVSTSCHPGTIQSDLARHVPKFIQSIVRYSGHPTSQGAVTQLYAGTSPETVDLNGKYFIPWARVGELFRPELRDPELGLKLWDWLESETSKYATTDSE